MGFPKQSKKDWGHRDGKKKKPCIGEVVSKRDKAIKTWKGKTRKKKNRRENKVEGKNGDLSTGKHNFNKTQTKTNQEGMSRAKDRCFQDGSRPKRGGKLESKHKKSTAGARKKKRARVGLEWPVK